MAITITPTPTYPVPGREVTLELQAGAGGNAARIWCTAAPRGSSLRQKLDDAKRIEEDAPRVVVFDDALNVPLRITFEVGGRYVFTTQEATRGASTYGGGYEGDPNAYPTETLVGSESSTTIYVGQRVSAVIGAPTYGFATLVMFVFNDTIRKTTLRTHGEVSPRLDTPTTERARLAADGSTMAAKLTALEDVTASNLIGDVDTLIQEMRTDIPAHMNDATAHAAGDEENDTAIERLPSDTSTHEGVHQAARTILDSLRRHMDNDGGLYHLPSANPSPDTTNRPVIAAPPGSSNAIQSYLALAELYRTYEAHRAAAPPHDSADVTNTLTTTIGPMIDLMQEFLRLLHPGDAAAAPPGDNPGLVTLTGAGFSRA